MFSDKQDKPKEDLMPSLPPPGPRGENSEGLSDPHVEIQEVPESTLSATLLHVMHLEEQGKLENALGTSLGTVMKRHRRMEQVAAVAAGDIEKIEILEQQDNAFRLENITRRQNSAEMLQELKSITASGQFLRINDSAWFAAECLLSQQSTPVVEAAIEVLEMASQISAGAADRVNAAAPVLQAAFKDSRFDLLERFAVIRRRAQ